MAQPPGWMASFKYLRHSLRSADSRKAFDLIYELIKNESSAYRIFRLIGLAQGFFSIMEYFAGYANRGRVWSNIHTSEVVENLIEEIQSCKRKSLE